MGFSIFGKSSSSSSSVQNTYNTDNTALGAEAAEEGVAIVVRGDNNNLELLDGGAIDSAFGFAERNASAYADATRDIVEGYGGVVQQFGATSERLAEDVIDFASATNQLTTSRVSELAQQNANDLRSFAQYQSQSESGRLAQLIQWGIIAAVAIIAIQRFNKRASA